MAIIRDSAVTIYSTATASMVCNMPTHVTGDLLVASVAKDTGSAFTTPASWNAIRTVISAGAAGGVYTKWAASGSETVTFTLSTEECCAVVIAISGAEAEISSGNTTTTVNAAGLTYTRSAGSFTTDGFTVGQTVIWSGFANAGNNGPKEIVSITGAGTIMTVTSAATLVNEAGSGDEVCKSSGLDKSAARSSDDTTLPLTGIGVTPVADNCLILHGLMADIGAGISAYAPWVNIFPIDTGTASLSVSYSFLPTAAAITAPDHWATIISGVDERSVIICVRDNGGGTRPPYIPLSTTPSALITPLAGLNAVDAGTWVAAASIAITSVAGKTVTGVTIANTADAGYNPFRSSATNAGVSSTTNLNHSEFDLTSTVNLTTLKGLLFGTYQCTIPRDYLDIGSPAQGGIYILSGSTTTAWKAWVVGGQFDKETTPNRQNYLIEVGNSDTIYASSGTADYTATDYWAFGSAGYYGAPSVRWSELHSINEVIMAGGSSGTPLTFDEIVETINRGCGNIPLLQQAGASATVWCPIRFGGTAQIALGLNLNTFQLPTRADNAKYTHFHVSNNTIGFEFYGTGSSDVFTLTNCLFTSASSYYWRFNSSHSASTVMDFSGTSVVNANVTLRSTVSLSSMTFIDCSSFTQNNAALDNCSFDNTTVISDNPADISNSSFAMGLTGHGLQLTTPGTYTFTGNTFSGYSAGTVFGFHTTNDVDAGADVITKTAHNYVTGEPIEYRKQGGTVAIGLTDATTYYVRAVSSSTLAFYTSAANAIADSSRIALTSTGSETHYISPINAGIYNNSAGAVTLNVTGGDTPTIRNGSGASTTINNTVTYTLTDLKSGSEVRIFRVSDDVELGGVESSSTSFAYNYNYTSDVAVYIRINHLDYEWLSINDTLTSTNKSTKVFQRTDRNYNNP